MKIRRKISNSKILSMLNNSKSNSETIKLPKIKNTYRAPIEPLKTVSSETIDQREDDTMEVTKLQEWSMNKPSKKTKTMINTHNISFLYRSSEVRRQKTKEFGNNYKFMDAQLFIAKVDSQLQKIGEISYFSIYKNMQYCSGVYENSFNSLLKSIERFRGVIQAEVDEIQLRLQVQREEHLKKVHELQENANQEYKTHMNDVRQLLEDKQKQIKPLKKLLDKIDASKTKVLKYCLSLGYDVRQDGLVWIIKELGSVPKPDEFPEFLSQKEVDFIIQKYINEYEVQHAEKKMKSQIHGTTISQAYEYVNRRKRRQLSFIKENQELVKLYTNRIKDYSKDKHHYLYNQTLQIAQDIEKEKPKPTRYEVIYKETAKKLNKLCRQKIHPQIFNKGNKENKKACKEETEEIRRKQKRKSTIIIEEFSRMLNMSISQSKKLDELYTKEEKDFQEILRQIRLQKYNQVSNNKVSINKFQQTNQQFKLRNPISILSCLVGWKRAEKIIQQQMFGF